MGYEERDRRREQDADWRTERDQTTQPPEPGFVDGSTKRFPFEFTARVLNIPSEHWRHPTVREYVGFYNRVQQLQHDLSAADADHARRLSFLSGEVGALKPGLSARYEAAELLLRALGEIFQDGLAEAGGRKLSARTRYMQEKLNVALSRYGLEVVPISNPDNSTASLLPEPTTRIES